MRALTLAILFICVSAFGQAFTLNDPAWMVQQYAASAPSDPWAGYPTNIPGYAVYGWWSPDGTGGTNANGKLSNWVNQATGGVDLTNDFSNNFTWPYATNSLNGKRAIHFDGSTHWIRSATMSASTPWEIIYVMKYWDNTNYANRFWLGTGNGNEGHYADGKHTLGSGSIDSSALVITNKWLVWGSLYSPTAGQSFMRTNNVLEKSGTANLTLANLAIGSQAGGGSKSPVDFAEIILWKTNLTDTVRSNVFSYLTNKYALSP